MSHNQPAENRSYEPWNIERIRLDYVDAIRAFAIIGVVLVHVTSTLARSVGQVKTSWWIIGCCANAFGRTAVPLFVMISGLLLLDPSRQERIFAFLKKRLLRILIPFVGWAAIYLVWISLVNHSSLTPFYCVRQIAGGAVYTQFWFVNIILGLYCAAPILRIFTGAASGRDLWYLIGLWAFAMVLLPALEEITGITLGVRIVVVTGYVGYFVLGHILGKIRPTSLMRIMALACFAACWAVISIATVYSERNTGHSQLLTLLAVDYLSPVVCIMSVFSFVLVKAISFEILYTRAPFFKRIIMALSGTSFSIFFMHMIPLEILKYGSFGITCKATTIHPLFGIPCTVAVVCGLCGGTALAFKKVPVIKLLFP